MVSDQTGRMKLADDSGDDKTSVVRGGTFSDQLQKFSDTPPALVLLVGPQELVGRQWLISKDNMAIGRSMSSAIFIDDKSVSKSHAQLSIQRGQVLITDLESTNKTVVNGQSLPAFAPALLKNNDQIKVGNLLFKFLEKGSVEAAATQKIIEQSEKDGLTLIWNKAALLLKGPEFFKRARALNISLSMIVFDIDFFKKINDGFGHAAGDYILKELSQLIVSTSIRSDDYFARFGGEEFVILLFGSTLKQAQEIAERIRHTIQTHSFVFQGTHIPCTISLGVCEQNETSLSFDEMFEHADQALYQSKKNGRNQVTLHRP